MENAALPHPTWTSGANTYLRVVSEGPGKYVAHAVVSADYNAELPPLSGCMVTSIIILFDAVTLTVFFHLSTTTGGAPYETFCLIITVCTS